MARTQAVPPDWRVGQHVQAYWPYDAAWPRHPARYYPAKITNIEPYDIQWYDGSESKNFPEAYLKRRRGRPASSTKSSHEGTTPIHELEAAVQRLTNEFQVLLTQYALVSAELNEIGERVDRHAPIVQMMREELRKRGNDPPDAQGLPKL